MKNKNIYELTNPQKSILFTEQFYSDTTVNNICTSAIIYEEIDETLLKKAIYNVVKQNDSFRIHMISCEDNTIKQIISDFTEFNIDVSYIDTEDDVKLLQEEEVKYKFEFLNSDLFKFKIFILKNKFAGVILTVNHIIADSWSLGLVIQDILKNYHCLKNNTPIESSNYSYTNYINLEEEYKSSKRFQEDKKYWEEMFQTIPEQATIPSFKGNLKNVSNAAERLSFNIDKNLLTDINVFCKENNISVFNFFITIFSIYIGRVSNIDDFVIGTPILNRINYKDKHTMGMFVNTVPIRINNFGNSTFKEMAKCSNRNLMNILRHQKYSYNSILEDLRRKNENVPNLYNVLISYQVTKAFNEDFGKYKTDWIFNHYCANDFNIHLYDINDTGNLIVNYDYLIDKYSKEDVCAIHNRIMHMIDQILANNDVFSDDIEIVTEEEKDKILNVFNNTNVDYPRDKTIVDLFEEQVRKTPDNIAVVCNKKSLTYKELNMRSNQLANFLVSNGISSGTIIGIMLNRSIEMIIGLLGILKAGATYLPIDPEYPTQRILYMLENSKTNTILVDDLTSDILSNNYNKINISLANDIFNTKNTSNPGISISPCDLMYVIYTSGSTGNPKGVMLTHRNLNNFITGMKNKINFSSSKVMVSLTTICFDIFALEIWVSLTSGLKVIIANELEQKSIKDFNLLCINNKVSMVQTTPSRLLAFLDDSKNQDYLQNLSDIMIGGEPLPQILLEKLNKLTTAKIYNMYGPTETAVWSTIKDLSNSSITIGTPIANTTCYILDKNHQLLPPYVPGNLFIGGHGVSKGYLGNKELTDKKFISSPFNKNEIIYNTNDLAYFDNDGEIIHLGRSDFQVKFHGYRIELGEIENIISSFEGISSCAVICHKDNNNDFLCAYYSSNSNINLKKLKEFILSKVPIYMLPSYFIKLDKMPYTPNGKIDRKAFKFDIKKENKKNVPPKNDLEKELFTIISSIIKSSNFSMDDDLLNIGMDSINIISLSSKISNTFGISLSVKDLYETTSILELANIINASNKLSPLQIQKAKKSSCYPLSSAQTRIYYASKINEQSLVYNVSGGLLVNSLLDKNKITNCFKELINLHSSFRTCFKDINNKLCQVILDNVSLDINFYYDTENNLTIIKNNFPKPFDLSKAPLFRVSVYYLDNEKTLILVDSHHIIVDGTSLNIMIRDFCKLYNNEIVSKPPLEYIDYSMWENKYLTDSSIKNYEDYWINKFTSTTLPILNLPYDFSNSSIQSYSGDSITYKVSNNLFNDIEFLAKKYKVSPYVFMVSVFYILLYKYTGQTDIIIGSPMDSRNSEDLQNVVGMFVNNILLRNTVDSTKTFVEFLNTMQSTVIEALSNQPYPYDLLIKKLDLNTANSLLDVVFTYQNPKNETYIINKVPVNIENLNLKIAKFNLLLEVIPDNNEIRLEYNTDLFKSETANGILEHYLFILDYLTKNENQIISKIPIITDSEKITLEKFNNTDGPINNDTIISLFEQQVKLHPNNTALICDDKFMTYNDLNKKANSLAHLLISNGISNNDIVCIMTNRSLETIVCMLAILKAGAAFFNVDPTYPVDRTKYYIEDSKTKYVLTQKSLKDKVSEIENCIEIDLDITEIYNYNFENPNINVKKNDLSYIIYTSGSTGTPKGVMLNQVGFANMAKAMTLVLDYLKEGNKHTIASVTSTPFDIFVYEIFVSLTHGLKVVMANNAEHRNPKLLDDLIRKYNVDVMTVTPSLMKINYDNREPNTALANVKNMVFGGEPLPERFVKDLRSLSNDITIYNIYGPSEITILSNVQNLDNESEITVGPPIMNTKIHILDKNMQQVPIGVVGEIYISGIQVGLGYIGKPELTKEKFMDNPFGEGKIYRSGDIGRWTFDGKVQCLGRIDNQIKLRGLRIELGEIENIMRNIPNVSAAIVNKIDVDGKESLCGYYVSDSSVLETEVKSTLKRLLPYYMVPTYIIRLDEMPYTINRKIDRKALPLPQLNKSMGKNKINISELNSNEEKLLQIWKNILKLDDIDTDDNFFDIGGDSVAAIQMQIEALKYGLNFEYADIFNYPTIKQLSSKLPDNEINFLKNYDYTKINSVLQRNSLSNLDTIKHANINNILLIGSTGFLGAHIIDQFMKHNTGKIYCLIRPKNGINPTKRLTEFLDFYFGKKYLNQIGKRINIIKGDITQNKLGLSDNDYNSIINNIDVVINSGAIVKHYGLKQQFEDINVLGTKNVVDFCKKENKRLLHISTISVSGSGEKEEAIDDTNKKLIDKKQFSENTLYIGQKIKGIYTTTKYRAELIVLEAIAEGLDAQILRLGNITSRYSDGVFQQNVDNNAFAKRLKSFIEIEAIPKYLLNHSIELTPVDLAAESIIYILNSTSICNVFHIFDTKLLPVTLLLTTLNDLGFEILPISNSMMSSLLTGILADDTKKDILSGIIYDLDDNKQLIYTYDINLNSAFTEQYLKNLGFEWKEINQDYIKKYINYFKKINFIKDKEELNNDN